MLKETIVEYLVGVALSLLIILIVIGTIHCFPSIGWHFLTVMFIDIFAFQIIFYYLTTNYNIKWTALSFIVNFCLWTFEQVTIEKNFHETIIYQDENYKVGVCILGAILWVTNKVVIDKLLEHSQSIKKRRSKLSKLRFKEHSL